MFTLCFAGNEEDTSTNQGTKLSTSETVQYDFSDKRFREPSPPLYEFYHLLPGSIFQVSLERRWRRDDEIS